MSEKYDQDFYNSDDAKAEIRAAARYLLIGADGSDRGDIMREIIEIVHEVARELSTDPESPLDEGFPGG